MAQKKYLELVWKQCHDLAVTNTEHGIMTSVGWHIIIHVQEINLWKNKKQSHPLGKRYSLYIIYYLFSNSG